MKQGFTIDHVTPAGRLLTVFSAPDYPQFQVPPHCLLRTPISSSIPHRVHLGHAPSKASMREHEAANSSHDAIAG